MKAACRAVVAASLLLPAVAGASALDSDLRAALAALARGEDVSTALGLIDRATTATPGLGTAHLLRAELFGLLGGLPPAEGLSRIDGPSDMTTRAARLRPSADVAALRTELRARAAWLGRPEGTLPLNLLGLEPGMDHAILVDISAPRVFLLARQGDVLAVVAEYYASVGLERGGKTREGDMRTPVGAFRIKAELRGRQLRSYHGPLALVLDYPNADDRAAGRTGSHIWIHGVSPGVTARPPYSTEGCVALANADLLALRRAIRPERTVVVIAEGTSWVSDADWRAARATAVAASPDRTLAALGVSQPVLAMRARGRTSVVVGRPPDAPPVAAVTPRPETASPRAEPLPTSATGSPRLLVAGAPFTLRREPRGEPIGTIARGEPVQVLHERSDGWLQVRNQDRTGFVFGPRLGLF